MNVWMLQYKAPGRRWAWVREAITNDVGTFNTREDARRLKRIFSRRTHAEYSMWKYRIVNRPTA